MRPEKYEPYKNLKEIFKTPYSDIRPLHYYNIYDFTYIIPECFLFTSMLLLLFFGSIYFKNQKNEENMLLISRAAIAIFLITILLLLNNLYFNRKGIIFYDLLAIENFSTVIKIVVVFLTVILLFSGRAYMRMYKTVDHGYIVVLGFVTAGLLAVLSANDFMSLFCSIELVSYGLYTLANLHNKSVYGVESSLKYYITGMISCGFFAFGASLIYLQTKTLNFTVLHYYIYKEKNNLDNFIKHNTVTESFDFSGSDYILLILGLASIFVLILFKIAAAPFHVWSPDVYEGAPMLVTAYFSIVIKFVMLIILLKIATFVTIDFVTQLRPGMIFVCVLSLLVGSIGAVGQDKLKRVFAYSSISHVGYIIMGLIPATETGFIASLIYIFVYTIGNVILFNFLLSTNVASANNEESHVAAISDLAKIGSSSPFLAFLFCFALFSFAGIPPFGGFFAKLGLFYALMTQGYGLIVLIAFISTAISCFYYLKLIKAMFFVGSKQTFVLEAYDQFKETVIFWSVIPLAGYVFIAERSMTVAQSLLYQYYFLYF